MFVTEWVDGGCDRWLRHPEPADGGPGHGEGEPAGGGAHAHGLLVSDLPASAPGALPCNIHIKLENMQKTGRPLKKTADVSGLWTIYLHLHLGHLADTFIQSDLQ